MRALRVAALFMFGLSVCGTGQTYGDVFVDDFEDGTIEPSKWITTTYKAGTGGVGAGSAVSTAVETGGMFEGRVTTPASGNTYGGWSSLRTVHDFNDGLDWTINFTWEAIDRSPAPRHANYHFIQISDGSYNEAVIPQYGSPYTGWWTPEFSTLEEGDPIGPVANTTPDGTHHLYFTNDVQVGPSEWSVFIDSTAKIAAIYDGPDLTGNLVGTTTLDASDAWHLRWATSTGTSGGFPAKDISFRLDDFEAKPVPVDVNSPPVADAGPDQTAGSTGEFAAVQLDGTGSYDPDDDTIEFEWSVPEGSGAILDDPTSATPLGLFPRGPTLVTLTVTDGEGGIDVTDILITVEEDTTPPIMVCTTDTIALWPPNHEMVDVEVYVEPSETCTYPEDLILRCMVSSSEPDDASGDGEMTGDVNGSDAYAQPVEIDLTYDPFSERFVGSVSLRAERDGSETSRSYSIVCGIWDFIDGNVGTASCVVVVPHDRRKK